MKFSRTAPLVLVALAAACAETPTSVDATVREPVFAHAKKPVSKASMIDVGQLIFHDASLSRRSNQSCSSCHTGDWGFFGPDDGSIRTEANAFFEGSIAGRFGDRKPPSAAYASFAPPLGWDQQEGTYRGGSFWDGRATGGKGITAIAAQGLGPFAAGPEHAFSPVCVIWEISQGLYGADFFAATGVKSGSVPFAKISTSPEGMESYCHDGEADLPFYPTQFNTKDRSALDAAYIAVGNALGAFQNSPRVNRFSSRFDTRIGLTAEELEGEALFFGASGCDKCHSSEANAPQIFTDFSYYNIGVPRHPLRADFRDPGLGGFLAGGFDVARAVAMEGFFKSPGLRNVDKRVGGGARTYMHNGSLTTLEQVVHFYNTRDVRSCAALGIPEANSVLPTGPTDTRANACWPTPDYPATLVRDIGGGEIRGPLGDLRLTAREEGLLVTYLKTLTDLP